jgi:hypothetical protein
MTLRTTAKRHEASNAGCKSGPTGHDFPDNSNIYFLFLPWEPVPPQNVRTGLVRRLDAMWESSIRFSWKFSSPILTENLNENWCRFSAGWWEPPNTCLVVTSSYIVHFFFLVLLHSNTFLFCTFVFSSISASKTILSIVETQHEGIEVCWMDKVEGLMKKERHEDT